MSEKKVGKRLLTWVLVLVMTLSLLPLNVLAAEVDGQSNSFVEKTDGSVNIKKSVSDGGSNLTLKRGSPTKRVQCRPMYQWILSSYWMCPAQWMKK